MLDRPGVVSRISQPISAGACSVGLGYHFDLPMDPQFWIYNDWASGDRNPGTGHYRGTFNQLFNFGHYYFGFIDVVGRQFDIWIDGRQIMRSGAFLLDSLAPSAV